MKILVITDASMINVVGGVEKVLTNFANAMINRGHEVLFAYCFGAKGEFYYSLNGEVKTYDLLAGNSTMCGGSKVINISIPLKLREFLNNIGANKIKSVVVARKKKSYKMVVERLFAKIQPDIIVSSGFFMTDIIKHAESGVGIPVINMCHSDAKSLLSWMTQQDMKSLSECSAIQVLMPSDINIFKKIFSKTQIVCIPNMVPQYVKMDDLQEKTIINVARIDKNVKRQHLLIKAFGKIVAQFPEWNVELWGDENGQARYTKELERLINKLHLQQRIKLCGRTHDVLAVYRRASIFAFPSVFEGFPLAMTEAMSAGLPVVAYRSCPAVNELVKDGETGLLVDDGVDALAEGLKRLMENEELRKQMGGGGTRSDERICA